VGAVSHLRRSIGGLCLFLKGDAGGKNHSYAGPFLSALPGNYRTLSDVGPIYLALALCGDYRGSGDMGFLLSIISTFPLRSVYGGYKHPDY
jgi:hypothetical protein